MSNNKKTIFLVNPFQHIKQYASNIGLARLSGKKTGSTPLVLLYLAALTPDTYNVYCIDEEIAPIPQKIKPDLVGITALSTNIERAFEIADMFRALNIPVVMGGPYASVCNQETLLHADSIVVGEADELWPRILDDFERNNLQKEYHASGFVDFKKAVHPRWDLVPTSKMAAIPVQVSRGCPHHCEFCQVSEFFGHTMRYREVDDVIAEVKKLPLKTVFFIDDNLTANKKYARELMAKLKPLKIQWFCMASIEIAQFPDLLKDMADCGCMHILIGFESLNPASLAETDKRQNRIETYKEAVARIHVVGLNVNGSFIVGFDNDTLDEYERLHAFMRETAMWYPNINILDVIPGSRLYKRMEQDGRLTDRITQLSGSMFPAMQYMNFSQIAIFERNLEFIKEIFDWEDIAPRILALFKSGNFANIYKNRDVPGWKKATITFKLMWIYLVFAQKPKRALFLALFALIKQKTVDVEKVVFFLLTVEGVHRQIVLLEKEVPAWRDAINKIDKGPWKNRKIGVKADA